MERATDQTISIIRKMGLLSRLHSRCAEADMGSDGLYRGQMMMLAYLSKCEHPVSQKDLASRFEISKPAATAILKRLSELGMVTRVVSSEDQRVKLVTISRKGRLLTENKREAFRALNERMVEGISEEELEVLSRVLDKMTSNLKALARS